MMRRTSRVMSVVGTMCLFGVLLAWSVLPAQAATLPFPNFPVLLDPAHQATVAVVFVKVDPKTQTDTILIVNRQQQAGITNPGGSETVKVTFYTDVCNKKFDANINVTPQGVGVLSVLNGGLGATGPGVVTAAVNPITFATSPNFSISGVVVDLNFIAVYERPGIPLLNQAGASDGTALTSNNGLPGPWGGLWNGQQNTGTTPTSPTTNPQTIEDWFLFTGGFTTMLQMMCPLGTESGTLGADMNAFASAAGVGTLEFPEGLFGTTEPEVGGFREVDVYDVKEGLRRSIHAVPCFCNTDSAFFTAATSHGGTDPAYPGDFGDIISSMVAVGAGTTHWETNPGFFDSPDSNDITMPGFGAIDPSSPFIGWKVTNFRNGGAFWDHRLPLNPAP